MNKENTMNEAQKIAQALAAIPADFQDKAVAATMRSQFWEIIAIPDIRVQAERLANLILQQAGAIPSRRIRSVDAA